MRWLDALMRACGGLAAALVGAMTALVCADVIGRNLGWGSLPWIVDVTEYALPIATLAAAPWLMWRNQHVRLDVLNVMLPPRLRAGVERLSSAAGLVVSLVIAWYGWKTLLDSRTAGSMVIKALVFPEWWLFVPVPIGFGLLAIACAMRLMRPLGADAVPTHDGERSGT